MKPKSSIYDVTCLLMERSSCRLDPGSTSTCFSSTAHPHVQAPQDTVNPIQHLTQHHLSQSWVMNIADGRDVPRSYFYTRTAGNNIPNTKPWSHESCFMYPHSTSLTRFPKHHSHLFHHHPTWGELWWRETERKDTALKYLLQSCMAIRTFWRVPHALEKASRGQEA
jgi:hypothetical protein